jgi:hypothetical protein
VPKTLQEQLEESFEVAEEEETGGPEEDTEESVGDTEEDTGEEPGDDDDVSDGEEPAGDSDDKPVSESTDEPGDEEPPEAPEEGQDYSKPPVSWKPAIREHWAKLPNDVKAEVMRREGEIQRGLQQASGHRKIADEYLRTVQPFQGLMQSMGATPSEAISTVMSTMAQLATGTVSQKAEVIAQAVQDYGVDIVALDTILSGQQLPEDPNAPLLQQFDEKLQPMYDFMNQMQGVQQTEDANIGQKAASDLMEFAADEKNEFFEDVRTVMADYLEVAANNQRLMTLKEAYDRACQDDPEIRKVIAQRAAALKAEPSGDELANKRRAAASVTGSPNVGGKSNENLSLHDQIAAQFEEAEEVR